MVPLTAATFYFYTSVWSVLRSQALEPSPEPCWKQKPGSAPKPPRPSPEPASQTFSGTFSGTLLNLTWLCTNASQTFSGTFSGTLLNLTWLCTKASQTFSGDFSGTLLNLTRCLHQCTPELFWAEDPISLRCWGTNSDELNENYGTFWTLSQPRNNSLFTSAGHSLNPRICVLSQRSSELLSTGLARIWFIQFSDDMPLLG